MPARPSQTTASIAYARAALDSLPPSPPPLVAAAPGDIYPRGDRERDLCSRASHADWLYLGALGAIDVGAIWLGSSDTVKFNASLPVRFAGPAAIGLAWGATVGGSWLALAKCDMQWVGEAPAEGQVRSSTPLAVSLALLAGATAPVINAIAIGPQYDVPGSTFEREMQVVTAGLAGVAGALVPYLIPPRTWENARQLQRLRLGLEASRGGVLLNLSF